MMKKTLIILGAGIIILIIILLLTDQPVLGPGAGQEDLDTFSLNDRFASQLDDDVEVIIRDSPALANQEQESVDLVDSPIGPPPLPSEYFNVTQAVIRTNLGNITVEFYKSESPATVDNFLRLAASGFYDGVRFHRVIENFMIQAGDPLSKDDTQTELWGTGGPGYTFADEINSYQLVKGSLAMANRGPDTNGSQFFVVTAEATPWLDGLHTNFGRVIEGLGVVEAIGQVETTDSDQPVAEVVIEGIELR